MEISRSVIVSKGVGVSPMNLMSSSSTLHHHFARLFTISGRLRYEAVMRVSDGYHDETKEM